MRAFDLPPSLASGDAPGGTPFVEPTHPLGNWELRNGVRSSYCPGIKRTHPPGRTLPGGVQACGNGFPPGSILPHGVQACGNGSAPEPTLMASVEDRRAGIRMIVVGCHLSRNPPGGWGGTYLF